MILHNQCIKCDCLLSSLFFLVTPSSTNPSYQDDYYVTSDQMYVPLRWLAPELVDEVHGNLLVADQTQQSNMWWEHTLTLLCVLPCE